jgi:hypothetical protein
MRRFAIMIGLLLAVLLPPAVFPQDVAPTADTTATGPAPGPGRELPPHSKPQQHYDLSSLQTNAIGFAQQLQTVAQDLFTFAAILALIWTGYHAQFRGLQEFVGVLMRIAITSALILHYRELIQAAVDCRHALIQEIYPTQSGYSITKQIMAVFASMSGTIAVMSLSGLALWIALCLVIIIAVLIYSLQLLLEAVLIAMGPLAIATMAFQNFKGIAEMWLKHFCGVFLVPVAWLMGARLYTSVFNGTDSVGDFLASTLFVCAFGAIYAGMPLVTTMIVNAAGGHASAVMPSIMSSIAGVMGMTRWGAGGGSSASGSAAAATTVASTAGAGGAISHSISTSVPGMPAGASTAQQTAYEQRIMQAVAHNQQFAARMNPPKPKNS